MEKELRKPKVEWTVLTYIDTGLMINLGTFTDFKLAMGTAMDFLQELIDSADVDESPEEFYRISPLYFLEGGENLGMTMYQKLFKEDNDFQPEWVEDQYIWFLRHEIKEDEE